MADRLTHEKRSWNMSRIRSRDTSPEIRVRRILHRMGYRFRVNRRDLPGSPDIVLPSHRTVIFVHGCYWHRHTCKNGRVVPKTRTDFWLAKFEANKCRDRSAARSLRSAGWRVVTIWECQTANMDTLEATLKAVLQR